MRFILILFTIFLLSIIQTFSQTIKGKVFGQSESGQQELPGSAVGWINTSIGTYTNQVGSFELSIEGITDQRLVVSSFGYATDTFIVQEFSPVIITLKPNVSNLNEVTLKSDDVSSSANTEAKTELVDQNELEKAACCDLAGCFETQATVQPVTMNIITNSKELRILGLSGVYNQVLIDGMPMIQGLTYTYGISGFPGTLVDKIYIAKGANSVLQGFESISGSINVILKDPTESDKLFLNAYMNSFAEKHFNANFSKKWGKLSTITSFHTAQPGGRFDRDKDTFLDVPLLTRYMLYNKWKYNNEDSLGFSTMLGLRYINEKRVGGQTSFNQSERGDTTVYGQYVTFQQPEIYTKTGYRFSSTKKISLISSAHVHNQNSYFGTIKYAANQRYIYNNLQYEFNWRSHELTTGISYRHLHRTENIAFTGNELGRTFAGDYLKDEVIPGVFAENSFNWQEDKATLITGLRLDHHNRFGYFVTPRSLIRFSLRESSTVRASAGTGFRTINLFSENTNLLSSSRNIIVTEELKPERAFNWGVNYTEKIDAGSIYGSLSLDFYQTRFSNQIFPDYDADQSLAIISNFEGKSISNGFQAEASFDLLERVDAKIAYTFLDVYRIVNGQKLVLPFNSKHKVMGSLSYEPENEKWHADMNFHWYGKQRIPNTNMNPEQYQRPSTSDPYSIVNLQFTKVWKHVDLYGGCENIFDFRQIRPILSWQDPFSPYFDSSYAWGPTRGREFYVGIRLKIE